MVTVCYVVGDGRSGSTLLDIILGSHPQLVSTGGLANLLRRGWPDAEYYCACGALSGDCPLWGPVRRDWEARISPRTLEWYVRLLSRYSGSSRPRSWIFALRESFFETDGFDAFSRATVALYESIREHSGCRIVVDSSKDPVRALMLSRMEGIDLRLVHLVRDGRAVAWSRTRSFREDRRAGVYFDIPRAPLWRTSLSWRIVNQQAQWVCSRLPGRSMRLRYEDVMADISGSLARIGELLDVDLSAVAEGIAAGRPVAVQHTGAGNRLRMSGSIRLRPDEEWREAMPRRQRRLVQWITWPVLGRYGYTRAPVLSGGVAGANTRGSGHP